MTVSAEGRPYAFGDVLPGESLGAVPAGTNLLVVGDETSGATELALRIAALAPRHDEHVVLVTTERTTAELVEAYASRLSDPDDLDHLYAVDASRSGLERETGRLSPARVEAATSPSDVTGIGVGFTNHLRSIKSERVRLGVCSLSPVVERLGAEQAFAFCHVLTSRVRSAGQLGLFVVDPTRHEPEHVHILRSLGDGSLALRTTADGQRQVRGDGVVAAVADWTDVE